MMELIPPSLLDDESQHQRNDENDAEQHQHEDQIRRKLLMAKEFISDDMRSGKFSITFFRHIQKLMIFFSSFLFCFFKK